MNNINKMIATLTVALAMGGCQSMLADKSDVSVSAYNLDEHGLYLHMASATFDHDRLVVSGGVKKTNANASSPLGHLDIAVYSTDGKLLAESATQYRPGIITTRANRKFGARFEAAFANVPAQPVKVKVAFHEDDISYTPSHLRSVFAEASAKDAQ